MGGTVQKEQTLSKEIKSHHGVPMSDEELAETIQCWKDIEDSIELVMKKGKDV